jgi:tetratricopeptide (TPR) repeat protein
MWACSNPNTPTCPSDDEEALFRQGWNQELEAQFEEAVDAYKSYLDTYPNGKYASTVNDRLLVCDEALNWLWKDIRDYFLTMAEDSGKDESQRIQCKSNAAWCAAQDGNFTDALLELDSLLDHASKDYEVLALSLSRMMVELQGDWSELESVMHGQTGGAHGHGGENVDAAPVVQPVSAYLAKVDSRLDSLIGVFSGRKGPAPVAAAIPKKYALYQNYPNPFNPVTEIRFDLPEAVRVELKVFNTLGQSVATLVNEPRAAGSYRVSWDGAGLASGLYIYQLKAGNFTDSKKMVLMK